LSGESSNASVSVKFLKKLFKRRFDHFWPLQLSIFVKRKYCLILAAGSDSDVSDEARDDTILAPRATSLPVEGDAGALIIGLFLFN